MNRKEQIIQLWRCCFEDSEDFIRRFFSQVYREENALTLEHDGQIVCAMQLLPYTISIMGRPFRLLIYMVSVLILTIGDVVICISCWKRLSFG